MSEHTSEVKTPKKFKPNIIDFLVVIAVIAAIAGVAIRAGIVDDAIESAVENDTPDEYALLTFVVNNVNVDSYGAFMPGDEFKAANYSMCSVGVLQEKSDISPAVMYITAADGSVISVASPPKDENDPDSFDRVDFSGVIKSAGSFDEEGYFLLDGTHAICPGSQISLVDKDVVVTVTVVDVKKAG